MSVGEPQDTDSGSNEPLRELHPPPPRQFQAQPLVNGEVVAERYRVEQEVGAGGMGVVYRVFDLELEEDMAIKVLQLAQGDSEHQLARFKQEIKLARKIVHPNVCRVYDFGNWRHLKFVIMELLLGETLDVYLERYRSAPSGDSPSDGSRPSSLALPDRLKLFRGILSGLAAAHRLEIIHRDLKPQNVLITGARRPVIMDFGLARSFESTGDTAPSEVYGTPSFTAPESLMGKPVDHRCDIYSLGVILFDLVCGRKPFVGKTVFDIAQKQLGEDPPRPRELVQGLPGWLDRAILKMLARDREQRFQTVGEIQQVFDLAAGEPMATVTTPSAAAVPAHEIPPPAVPVRPTVALPTVDEAAAEPVAEPVADQRTKKVLVIDDDEVFLEIAKAHLKAVGVEVVTASSGAEGLSCLHSEKPDLVCLDFRMPGMDGFHVAGYIGQIPAAERPPIFMTSAIQDPQYKKQASRMGIERFFNKPIDGHELAMAVRDRLGLSSG